MTITVWYDGNIFSFWPTKSFVAKWIISLPKGADIISCPNRGIFVRESDGSLCSPECMISCAKHKESGFNIIDGYDPDHWLERIDI